MPTELEWSGGAHAGAGFVLIGFQIDTPDDLTSGGYSQFTLRLTASPVPEPSSFALLALGGIGIGLYRKRRLK